MHYLDKDTRPPGSHAISRPICHSGSTLLSVSEGGRVGFGRSSTLARTLMPQACFMALSSCACAHARPCTLAVVGGWDGYLHMVVGGCEGDNVRRGVGSMHTQMRADCDFL